LEDVRTKLGLNPSEFALACAYWAQTYGGMEFAESGQTEEREPELSSPRCPATIGHKGRSSIWREEWEKLHLIRGIADTITVSSNALRRIFLVLGLEGMNGGKLDRMKTAMNLAISTRVRSNP
jgi:hypothetical protein